MKNDKAELCPLSNVTGAVVPESPKIKQAVRSSISQEVMSEGKKPRGGFVQVHRAVIADQRLSDGSFRLYCYLLDRKNSKNKKAWPTQEVMATDLKVTSKTIETRLKDLLSVGLIKKEKMKKWPDGRKVFGNRLCYPVFLAEEVYLEEDLKFNWDKEKKTTSLNTEEIHANESEEKLPIPSKKSTGLNQKEVSDSYIEQDRVGTIRNKEQERISIKDESVSSLFSFYCELLEKEKGLVPKTPLKQDLENLKMVTDAFGFEFTKGLLANTVLLWDEVQRMYPKLVGTKFHLGTLQSNWLHPLSEFYKKNYETFNLQTTDEFINALKGKSKKSLDDLKWENGGGW